MEIKRGRGRPPKSSTLANAGVKPTLPANPQTEPTEERIKKPARIVESDSVFVKLSPDGAIDYGKMKPEAAAKLRAAIGTSESSKELFSPAEAGALVSFLGQMEAFIAVRAGKVPEDIAKEVFIFKPVEIELLAPPAAAVLNKHVGPGALKYREEMSLAMALIGIHAMKMQQLKLLMKQREEDQAQANRAGADAAESQEAAA